MEYTACNNLNLMKIYFTSFHTLHTSLVIKTGIHTISNPSLRDVTLVDIYWGDNFVVY